MMTDSTGGHENLNDSKYFRDIKVVSRGMRKTSEIMSLFEFSEVIGTRISQIENGAPVYTDVTGLRDVKDMAMKELFDRKCPLKIIRRTGKFSQEVWSANEMGYPADVRSRF